MCSATASRAASVSFADVVRGGLAPDQIRSDDLAAVSVDETTPAVAVEPGSVAQVQFVLREAQNAGAAVIPHGGGTQLGFGNGPERYDVALSMRRLDRLIAYEPADMTVSVEAGMRLDDLQARLGEHGQWLPVDPPTPAGATIGGLLATNAFGPARHAHGTLRDWLLGGRVVHGDGSTSKSGGRVVKNVTGYDMHKLHVGALGTLGVIVEAAFKVAPRAKVDRSASIPCASGAQAIEVARVINDSGLPIRALETLSPAASDVVVGDARWCVLLRVASSAAAVERTVRDIARISRDASAEVADCREDVWEDWASAFMRGGLALRVSTPVQHVAAVCERVDREHAAVRMSATTSCGLIRVVTDGASDAKALAMIQMAHGLAAKYGGSVVVEAASVPVKREIDVFGASRADFEIMRRLKDELDPKRTLSPGRFLGRL